MYNKHRNRSKPGPGAQRHTGSVQQAQLALRFEMKPNSSTRTPHGPARDGQATGDGNRPTPRKAASGREPESTILVHLNIGSPTSTSNCWLDSGVVHTRRDICAAYRVNT